MKLTPTPGSVAGRRVDRAGDPLDGLINLFDLALVLAVGLLLAALSSIGAAGLIIPNSNGSAGTPLKGAPPTSGQTATGQGTQVGTVYRLSNGRYVFAPTSGASGGATGATGSSGSSGGVTGTTLPNGSIPPASGKQQPTGTSP